MGVSTRRGLNKAIGVKVGEAHQDELRTMIKERAEQLQTLEEFNPGSS